MEAPVSRPRLRMVTTRITLLTILLAQTFFICSACTRMEHAKKISQAPIAVKISAEISINAPVCWYCGCTHTGLEGLSKTL